MKVQRFSSRDLASKAAASWLTCKIRHSLHADETTGVIVSGGSTPKDCLEHLSKADLPWDRAMVSLTDERCVPVDDAASNEGMLREHFFVDRASAAAFQPVGDLQADSLSCALVGMGEDGHFASIFPDNPDLESLLDPAAEPQTQQVETAGSEHKRMTLNLAWLLQSDHILLLIFGNAKREIVNNPGELPIAALLSQDQVPVAVYWAP